MYDLAVVGAGVQGLVLALEAVRAGLRTIVFERNEIGRGTSANSLRIVHGGLRYLQSFDLPRFHQSVVARRWWMREFPERIRPLPCLMPLYDRGLHRRSVLRAALFVNDTLGHSRNRGVRPDRHLPRGRILDAAETRAVFGDVGMTGLRGAAFWYDAVIDDPDRLFAALAAAAAGGGAAIMTGAEVVGLHQRDGVVESVQVRSRGRDATHAIRVRALANCAGPWSRAVAGRLDRDYPRLLHPTLAFNLVLSRGLGATAAVAVRPDGPDGRTYFIHESDERTLAGTFHAPWSGPDVGVVPDPMIEDMIAALNRGVPGWSLRRGDVVDVQAGVITAGSPGGSEPARRAVIVDHGRSGGPRGLFSVAAVKLTAAPQVARTLLDRLVSRVRSPVRGTDIAPVAEP